MHIKTKELVPDLRNTNQSYRHKLRRIQKQEEFRQLNIHRFNALTRRELEIVILLAHDFNNPQIAEMLFISRHTVEQHRKNINRKLGINSYLQLYQFALAFNLV